MDLRQELPTYVRASYPFVAVCSHEEDRVLALLKDVASDVGVPLVPVSVTAARRKEPTATHRTCLEQLTGHTGPALFALVDFHHAIGEPGIQRILRDLRAPLEHRGQTAVFVSPYLDVPGDLQHEIVVFDMPLPTPEELAEILAEECGRAEVKVPREVAARAVRAVQGLTGLAARRAFRRALLDGDLAGGDVQRVLDEKRRVLRRTDLLEFVQEPPPLSAVGGLTALKEWLVEREAAFDERARQFGLPTPKGLLLVGVQGCGKSLTAKAVASLWRLPLARLDFGALFTYGHSPEQNLKRVLRLGEALSPVVLWVDEIDKAFASVSGQTGSSEALTRVFASFITWMQEKTAPVFVVATANAVDHLPAELLRKGRFDEIFFVDLPSQEERERILAIHLRGHGRDPARFDLAAHGTRCEHFSGAEIEQVVVAGLYRAFQKRRDLNDEDLEIAAKGTVPLYRTAEEQIKTLREWAKSRARRASPDARLAELWTTARKPKPDLLG